MELSIQHIKDLKELRNLQKTRQNALDKNTIKSANDNIDLFLYEHEDLPGTQDYFTRSRRREGGDYDPYIYNNDAVSSADKLSHLDDMINSGRTLQEFGNGTPSNDFNDGKNFSRIQDPTVPTNWTVSGDDDTSNPIPTQRNPDGYLPEPEELEENTYFKSLSEIEKSGLARWNRGKGQPFDTPPPGYDANQSKIIQDNKGHINVLQNQLKAKQNALNTLQTQYDNLSQNDIDDETVKQHLKNLLSAAEKERDRIRDLLDSNTNKLSNERSQHQEDLNRLSGELADAHNDDTIDDSRISDLEGMVNNKQQLIEKLNSRLNDDQTAWIGFKPETKTDDSDRRLTDGQPAAVDPGMYPGNIIGGPIAENVEDKDKDEIPDIWEDDQDITVEDEDIPEGEEEQQIVVQSSGTTSQYVEYSQPLFELQQRPSPHFTSELLKNVWDTGFYFGKKAWILGKAGAAFGGEENTVKLMETVEHWGPFFINLSESSFVSLRHHNKDPTKITIFGGVDNLMKSETHMIKSAAMIPFISLFVFLYIVRKDMKLGLADYLINDKMKTIYFLNMIYDFLKMGNKYKNFVEFCVNAIPDELVSAFVQNKDILTPITYGSYIKSYQKKIIDNFMIEFKADLFDQIHIISGKHDYNIHKIFDYLETNHFLFELHQTFGTFDDLLQEAVKSKEAFIGLINLLSGGMTENKNTIHQKFLDKSFIDGIVYYNKSSKRINDDDINLKLLKNTGESDIDGFKLMTENEDVSVYMKDNKLKILFKPTNVTSYNHLIKNFLVYQGKHELFTDEKYNNSIKKIDKLINLFKNDYDITIAGYSLGGVMALYLGMTHPDVKTEAYSPVVPKNETWDAIIRRHKEWDNIRVHSIKNDVISRNLKFYKGHIPIFEHKKKDLLNHHDLNNF